jgi:hypothetical protein
MSGGDHDKALFSAAVLKVSMMQKGLGDSPGFRVVYMGTIQDLGVTDDDVNTYIATHKDELLLHINQKQRATKSR